MKKTKMVCTIGPKSEKREIMETLLNSGMNVMRLNFSHGDFEEHGGRITNINAIMQETGKVFAVLLDTKGPEIRTCDLENGEDVSLVTGDKITLTSDSKFVGNKTKVGVTYPNLAKDLKVGATVLLDDGLIGLKVIEINGGDVVCEVQNNGDLGEHKGVNLPNTHISMPFLSEKDKGDLLFGIKRGVDFIAASFTRTKADVLDIPAQDVIFAQKHIIKRCNQVGKTVITATQMLDSMIKNPRPTRAEAGDVTNAILDGTDAVMLSGESAKGKYPREAVRTMNTICERTDSYCEENHGKVFPAVVSAKTVTDSACLAAVEAADALNVPVIVVATEHGNSARAIRKFNPKAEILALTPNVKAARQLCVTRGVMPKIVDRISSTDEFLQLGKKLAVEMGLAKAGDKIVMVNGALVPSGITNTMSVQTI